MAANDADLKAKKATSFQRARLTRR